MSIPEDRIRSGQKTRDLYPGFGNSDVPDPAKFTYTFDVDLPKAEMHRLDAGHFAVENCLDYISSNIHRYYHDVVGRKG